MPIRKNILHLWTCLLLATAFVVTLPLKSNLIAGYKHETVAQKKVKPAPVKKSSENNTGQKEQNPDNTIIKAASPENIVSFSGIQLAVFFYTDFSPKYPNVLSETGFEVPKPLFILSYFENTFCHHIAINAP